LTSAAEAATKREGFGCRALSAVSFQRTAFRCLFLIKESIRYPSTAQVDNTEHCYHTRLGKVKSPISQLYNFACAPAPERECRRYSDTVKVTTLRGRMLDSTHGKKIIL